MAKTTALIVLLACMLLLGCVSQQASAPTATPAPSREESIPASMVKITPQADIYPPQLNSSEWEAPVPVAGGVNTAGAEDSPFVTPDGNTLYFFFSPDPNIPVEKQLFDGVTGIWVSRKVDGVWGKAERVVLQEPGKLSLDGCEFVQGNIMWFCSAREGYTGVKLFTAEYADGKWGNFQYAGDKLTQYEAGEMHLTADGSTMYFHSGRAGGKGGLDIWTTTKTGGEWQQPVNVAAVNTAGDEGWPFISQDGSELWFLRTYLGSPALFRSKKAGNDWSAPELIVSQFAGEPTLDNEGNLYFVHHYYKDAKMLEADIYFAKKK